MRLLIVLHEALWQTYVNDKPVTHSVLAMLSPDRKGTAPELAGCSESCAEWATLAKHFTGSMA